MLAKIITYNRIVKLNLFQHLRVLISAKDEAEDAELNL